MVDFEYISHIILVFSLFTKCQMERLCSFWKNDFVKHFCETLSFFPTYRKKRVEDPRIQGRKEDPITKDAKEKPKENPMTEDPTTDDSKTVSVAKNPSKICKTNYTK